MKKIIQFWFGTHIVSRILFVFWLIISGLVVVSNISDLLFVMPVMAIPLLIPAILIERSRNPVFKKIIKIRYIFGVICLMLSMGGLILLICNPADDPGGNISITIVFGMLTFLLLFPSKINNGYNKRYNRNVGKTVDRICKCENDDVPEKMCTYDIYNISHVDGMDGHSFEYFCAEVLRCNGFHNVEVTKGSGDQGVDILAEKDGIKYAVQCKNYSSPLGNTPVQEVNAGMIFYKCHIGVVLTNSTFTSGAKELAESTRILLWDRSVLEKMMQNRNTKKNGE